MSKLLKLLKNQIEKFFIIILKNKVMKMKYMKTNLLKLDLIKI